jgi:hypothetical protein
MAPNAHRVARRYARCSAPRPASRCARSAKAARPGAFVPGMTVATVRQRLSSCGQTSPSNCPNPPHHAQRCQAAVVCLLLLHPFD